MIPSDFLKTIREKAVHLHRTIVLPDARDERALQAAEILTKQEIAKIILLGDPAELKAKAASLNIKLTGMRISEPKSSEHHLVFSQKFAEIRKSKGLTLEEAKETMKHPLYFGAMLVREGAANGSVAGSLSTTGDVIRAAIQVIGLQEGVSIVSSFFLIIFPDKIFSFADSAVVPDPDEKQLADIAITTAINYEKLIGEQARVAMLSFSTKGSADHPLIDKVRNATGLAKTKRPDIILDGELQLDAAIVPKVAKSKAPGSPIQGDANVLIFPNLDAGNISYKMAQRLGGAEAVGPIVQGLRKPAFDLSRGCSVDDIVNTVAINCVMGN
ncbi:MAG: phosphate acetyltransferase [Bacteroidota bacterium]